MITFVNGGVSIEKFSITAAEWEVMRVVWSTPNISSRQIISTLQNILSWKEGTIKSLISRLVHKGLLLQDSSHKPANYQAPFQKKQPINKPCTKL